jgi:hypothetical protein
MVTTVELAFLADHLVSGLLARIGLQILLSIPAAALLSMASEGK